MIETRKLVEKLHELDNLQASRDNYNILAFATEAANCILEINKDIGELELETHQAIREIKEQFPERFV